MKKLALACLFFLSINAYSQEFYETLTPSQRQNLALSYRAAGNRFLELGQKARGNQYLKLAEKIEKFNNQQQTPATPVTTNQNNPIVPITTVTPPVTPNTPPAVEPLPSKKPDPVTPPVTPNTPPAVEPLPSKKPDPVTNLPVNPPPCNTYEPDAKQNQVVTMEDDFYFFKKQAYPPQPVETRRETVSYPKTLADWPALPVEDDLACDELLNRYLVALTTKDSPLMLSVLADLMALPGYDEGLNKTQEEQFYLELFGVFQFDTLTVNDLYNLETKNETLFNDTQAMITLKAQPNSPNALADWHYWEDFWGTTHYYFFEKIEGEWKMIAFDIDYAV